MTVIAPVRADAGVQANPHARAVNDNISQATSEVDSDGSSAQASSLPFLTSENLDLGLLWMPPGNMEFTSCVAYATINDDTPTLSPAPFIRVALFFVASNTRLRLFPSSQGHMMLVFDSAIEHDMVVDLSPVIHDGGRVSLVRSEETENRFWVSLDWLVAVSATHFPPEHWTLVGIPAAFRQLGIVVEIDSDCLQDHDFLYARRHRSWPPGPDPR